jgi:hypothetical protein
MVRSISFVLVGVVIGPAIMPGVALAQNPGADLIPADALMGLVVKSINDVDSKRQKLSESGARLSGLGGISLWQVLSFLPLDKGVNPTGSAGIIIPNLEKLNVTIHDPPTQDDGEAVLKHVVLVLPIKDADTMAPNFGLRKGELKPGLIATGHHPLLDGGLFGRETESKLLLVDKYLYASHSEAAIKAIRESIHLPASLNRAHAQVVQDADVVVHGGVLGLGNRLRDKVLSEVEKNLLLGDPDDPGAKEAVAASKELRGATVAVKIDDGLTLDLLLSFTKPDGAAARFLTVLRGGPGTSDLNGLPAANPIGAFAAKGDGTRNAHQARALFKLLLKQAFGLDVVLEKDDRAKLLAAFDVLYKHLRGSRAAAYAVDANRSAKVGQMAAIVILDLDDPAEHLTGWKDFIDVANKMSLKMNQGDGQKAPRFSFTPAAERLDGLPVDVLAMENPKLGNAERDTNVRNRGPDWNKIKMVTVGKQIVALFGSSDTDLLREAIRNVRDGKKGLAENTAMMAHLKDLPAERKIELHGTGELINAFGIDLAAKGPTNSWMSLALVVEPDRLQVRWRLPAVQLKALR